VVIKIGLAMIQGARFEHEDCLKYAAMELGLDIEVIYLNTAMDLLGSKLDALVLPGGESTTMRKVSDKNGLFPAIYDYLEEKPSIPVLATCAGAILLVDPGPRRKPFLDASIDRNYYGSQKESFQANLRIENIIIPSSVNNENFNPLHLGNNEKSLPVEFDKNKLESTFFPGIFIRAPRFNQISSAVERVVFHGDEVVGILQNSKLALTFHPELSTDFSFHRWLLSQVSK
tara:strand:- start:5733 stop:6422 length:690 start_codon:yes stop_codon:yes gene_type:complete